MSFQTAVLGYLEDIKTLFVKSEEKRVRFEARMQTEWELFTKKVLLAQGQFSKNEDESVNEADFEELDSNFPIKSPLRVGELELNVRQDMVYKQKLVNASAFII